MNSVALTILMILSPALLAAPTAVSSPGSGGVVVTAEPTAFSLLGAKAGPDTYNHVIGTQTFGSAYQFTQKAPLLETAEAIRSNPRPRGMRPMNVSGWLKGNLHTHTVRSDGDATVEQGAAFYAERG